jgi:hypothetical protein
MYPFRTPFIGPVEPLALGNVWGRPDIDQSTEALRVAKEISQGNRGRAVGSYAGEIGTLGVSDVFFFCSSFSFLVNYYIVYNMSNFKVLMFYNNHSCVPFLTR